jgi:transportin-3
MNLTSNSTNPNTNHRSDSGSSISISSNADEELHRVLSALSTVFSANTTSTSTADQHGIANSRESADRYLTQFQRSSIAWIVADRLLSSTKDETGLGLGQVHFFAAQTLHTKCRADILQLDPSQFNSLRESLMKFLIKFISATNSNAVVTRLAMALCCLAVQMKWDTIMDDLLANLEQQSASSQQQQMMELVLSVAKLLPEEVTSDRVLVRDELQRHAFVAKLTLSAEKILQFLFYCASHSQEVKVREQVLRCLHSWIKYVNIRPALLQQTQLVDFIFAILQANDLNVYGGDLFEISVDVIIEIIRCYPSDRRENMVLVQKFIPLLMALGNDHSSPFRKAVQEEDEDGMRDYCRIFTEMGESYMSLIMHHEDLNQAQLVDLVLDCSAIPDNGECQCCERVRIYHLKYI